MTIDDLKEYFGTIYQMNKQTGLSFTSFYKWKKQGYIGIRGQIKLEEMTNGALKASLDDAQPIKTRFANKTSDTSPRSRNKD